MTLAASAGAGEGRGSVPLQGGRHCEIELGPEKLARRAAVVAPGAGQRGDEKQSSAVVGLVVYLLLSNAGPLGWLQLLYTPAAMIIAQTVLITPIVAALTREVVEQLHDEYAEQFRSLSVPPGQAVAALLWDARYSLLTVALAGFGRAVAEVGAVIIVGGNIDHLTRVMTTAIALETSKGNLALALALGMVLLTIALSVNAAVMMLRLTVRRYAYA